MTIRLPPRPTWDDLDLVADQFGLGKPGDKARDVIKRVIHENGLGKYIKFLQNGHRMAANEGETMTWRHFMDAYAILEKLAHLNTDEKELKACV